MKKTCPYRGGSPLSKLHKTFRQSAVGFCFILFAVFGSAAIQTAGAADVNGKFSIRGGGTALCKHFVNASPAVKKIAETWWAGYLTAMNRTTAKTYDIIGNLSVKNANDWLVRYCIKHPNRRFAFAVHDLLKAAYDSRTKVSP